MSDQRVFFPCQMGENRAFIFYDHGIRDSINTVTPHYLLNVRVAFKQPRPDGMPSNEEFTALTAFEADLRELVRELESGYVGRITVGGHRHFYIYTSVSDDSTWSPKIEALGKKHAYPTVSALTSDEGHDGYWQELFPTDDDWQVIQDLDVLETLRKEGDDGSSSRLVDHWAYFSSLVVAEQFSQWSRQQGFKVQSVDATDNDKFRARFSHKGAVLIPKITAHTIALRRKAHELGGDYDGWETPVCKTSTS